MATVERTHHRLGTRNGLTTLEQRFRFTARVDAGAVADVLAGAPLIGANAIFGRRPGTEEPSRQPRTVRGFSPAPGFRFDVELTRASDAVFLVRFTQPDRRVSYLQGEFVWAIGDEPGGAVLDEQINTQRALEIVDEPLSGARPSLRRWLFFRAGHRRVMAGAAKNIAELLHGRP